jgi:hypothetical protein
MCTVTFIPSGGNIYITSNRDEKSWRKQALSPRFYIHNDAQLLYPRDEDEGGSWIAVNENRNVGVLLNGAFVKHIPLSSYRKSRGLIFLDIIKAQRPVRYFSKIDLSGIQPFTIIIVESKNLFECRWEGKNKHCSQLRIDKPYIWSSVTLYDKDVIKKREQWFYNWIDTNKYPTQNTISNFHFFVGDGNKATDLLMNRGGKVYTVSITSVELNNKAATMQYFDLKNKEIYSAKMQFPNTTTIHHEYNA